MIFHESALTALCAFSLVKITAADSVTKKLASTRTKDNYHPENASRDLTDTDSFVPRKILWDRQDKEAKLMGNPLKNSYDTSDTRFANDLDEDLGILSGNHRSNYDYDSIPGTRDLTEVDNPWKPGDDCNAYCNQFKGRPRIPADKNLRDLVVEYLNWAPYAVDYSGGDRTRILLQESPSSPSTLSARSVQEDPYPGPINCWDTSQVTDMEETFSNIFSFNKPLGCWDTSSVTSMARMFLGTAASRYDYFYPRTKFNQPIDTWNVTSVTSMEWMFYKSYFFNQCLATWPKKAPDGVNVNRMFKSSGCPSRFKPQLDIGPWCQNDSDSCVAVGNSTKPAFDGWQAGDDCNAYCSQFGERALIPSTENLRVKVASYLRDYETMAGPMNCWNTSLVTDMSFMFTSAVRVGAAGIVKGFNEPIGCWDTSSVTDMRKMFGDASSFNQSLTSFNTSSVFSMGLMFSGASSFNQPLDSFDTSSVVGDMGFMFSGASSFNQPLNSFDTSSVFSMSFMFSGASSFNQPLDSFNTSSVGRANTLFKWKGSMKSMFEEASSFNQPLDSFDTSAVENMNEMFKGASSFNQCLSSWANKIPGNVRMNEMFLGSACPNQDDPSGFIGPWCQELDTCKPTGSARPTLEPTKFPTSAPSESFTLAPTLPFPTQTPVPSATPTDNPPYCEDESGDTKFKLGGVTHTCTSLRLESFPTKNRSRQRKICRKFVNVLDTKRKRSRISELCPRTCELCADQCVDSNKWFSIEYNGKVLKRRKCSFVSRNGREESKQMELCRDTSVVLTSNRKTKKLKTLCPNTCGRVRFGRCGRTAFP